MAFKLRLETGEITEVSRREAESAMKEFGYTPSLLRRLATEATIFYTGGDAFYSRDRFRLDERLRESKAEARG